MVADAEGEVVEARAVVCNDEPEDHPEATRGRREVDLEALREPGPLAMLWIAGPKAGAGDTARFVSTSCSFSGLAASRRRSRHILSKGLGIEASREMWLAGQRLPLAVGGKHVRTMLRQEALPLLFGGIAGAGALLDGLPRGIRHQGERPIGALVRDDVLANSIAAELDVRMELHAPNLDKPQVGSRVIDAGWRRAVISF